MAVFGSKNYETRLCEIEECYNIVYPDNEADVGIGFILHFSEPVICENCYELIEAVTLLLEYLFEFKSQSYEEAEYNRAFPF